MAGIGDVDAVALLGDPQRRAIYGLLQRSGAAMSRDQLADSLAIPRSSTAFQLAKLSAAGLVESEFRKLSGRSGPGSGRPSRLYRASREEVSASVPERHYGLAASLMAQAIEQSATDGSAIHDALARVAFDAGARMGAAAAGIEEVLGNNGYSPEPDGAGGYRLPNCPFHRLARNHADVVCALNGALLAGALTGCLDDSHTVQPDGDLHYCCARITAAGTGAAADR